MDGPSPLACRRFRESSPTVRILFVSLYAEPQLVGGNNNVFRQAKSVCEIPGAAVEILTWPLECEREGLCYRVVGLPKTWQDRILTDSEWDAAVALGVCLLQQIQPTIVHLQHWRGLWWILEAAQRLSIPTVYSVHDWGMVCLRTILVTGEGALCDGRVDAQKCAACVWKGRSCLGKFNESFVSCRAGEMVMEFLFRTRACDFLLSRGALRAGLRSRIDRNVERARRILGRLDALIVANSFAGDFFSQFGVAKDDTHVLPWYYDGPPVSEQRARRTDEGITLGYIGRISPEKGLHLLIQAILQMQATGPIRLVIAGAVDNPYAEQLCRRHPDRIGEHRVEWLGWMPHGDVSKFYSRVDVVVIPSLWMDNTPLTLIESCHYHRPVIAVDIPPTRDLVRNGVNGYLFPFGDARALAQIVREMAANPDLVARLSRKIPGVLSAQEYGTKLVEVYRSLVE